MKVAIYDKKAPKHFAIQEVDKPLPKENEVIVQTTYTSLNAADYRSAKMGIIPKSKILGSVCAGSVHSVGSNVKDFKIGDHVMADLSDHGFGGLAEFIAVPSKLLVTIPKELKDSLAVTLPLAATTALQALKKSEVSKGDDVLIIGSSGGVGSFAVQLAHYFGANVTGVCSTENMEQTMSLGADKVIDYTKESIFNTKHKFNRIIMVNGSYSLMACKGLMKENGRYVSVGGTLGQILKTIVFGKLLSLGSKKIRVLMAKVNTEDLKLIADLTTNGDIKPVIDKVFDFTDVAEAMDYVKTGHSRGKVVIQFSN